jgi:glucokinase
MPADGDRYGAIDLGGTQLRAVVADLEGRIEGEEIGRSHTEEGPEAVMARMEETLRAAARGAGLALEDLKGVGIASPGAVDVRRGIVPDAPQLPGWRDVPLVDLMASRLGVPVVLENDASAGALGEHTFGAGRGAPYMLYLTVSTGVGGGIIIDGDLYRGASGAAGELGHVIIQADGPPCGCGGRGCVESLVSGTAIARRGEELVEEGKSPALAEMRRAGGRVTAEMVARAALAGDSTSLECMREVGRYLGIALAGFVNTFNPTAILIGGGVARAGDLFMDEARTTMSSLAMSQPLRDVRVDLGTLGDRVSTLGMIARLRKMAR